MLIQHILTEEIFSQVFDDPNFHHDNNVARELYELENTFFTGKAEARDAGGRCGPTTPRSGAPPRTIASHHEKQTFLKIIYENFYKVYNKKAADRLGVVYTPNEIVRFMIESADWLCQKHFGKPDRQGRGNPRSGRRHRHLHQRTDRALPRPAGEAASTSTARNCTPTRSRSCPITSPT